MTSEFVQGCCCLKLLLNVVAAVGSLPFARESKMSDDVTMKSDEIAVYSSGCACEQSMLERADGSCSYKQGIISFCADCGFTPLPTEISSRKSGPSNWFESLSRTTIW